MSKLFPDEYIESAYIIDYDRLYREGCRGVIYDVDNTLVPHGAPPDDRAAALFRHLHEIGMSAVFVSNNGEARVKKFADIVDEQYIFKARKPSVGGYYKAMELMGTDTRTTVFVGDQIFTDIWGARRAGIRAVLVKPIHPKEEIQIILKRRLEAPILLLYKVMYRRKKERAAREGRALPTVTLKKNQDGTYPEPYGKYNGAAGTMKTMQE